MISLERRSFVGCRQQAVGAPAATPGNDLGCEPILSWIKTNKLLCEIQNTICTLLVPLLMNIKVSSAAKQSSENQRIFCCTASCFRILGGFALWKQRPKMWQELPIELHNIWPFMEASLPHCRKDNKRQKVSNRIRWRVERWINQYLKRKAGYSNHQHGRQQLVENHSDCACCMNSLRFCHLSFYEVLNDSMDCKVLRHAADLSQEAEIDSNKSDSCKTKRVITKFQI